MTDGRNDRAIFWCERCDWHGAPVRWPIDQAGHGVTICPHCGSRTKFVAYQAGWEDDEAWQTVGRNVTVRAHD